MLLSKFFFFAAEFFAAFRNFAAVGSGVADNCITAPVSGYYLAIDIGQCGGRPYPVNAASAAFFCLITNFWFD